MTSSVKTCGACRQTLDVAEFSFKSKRTGLLQSKCKACVRAYGKQHYVLNQEAYVEKARVHNKTYRARNLSLVGEALQGQECAGCRTHVDLTFYAGGADQGQPVHMAAFGALSEQTVLDAIARSVIVCKPCLGHHFGKSMEFWAKLRGPERQQLQTQRAAAGYRATPRDHFKAYRRVDGSVRPLMDSEQAKA
jgi:hypothetical protein